MGNTSLKYEEPTWTSKLMVVGFTVAVTFMAGWLALAVVLGRGGSMVVATADEEVPAMTTKQPPRVETPTAMGRPLVASKELLSPQADPANAPGAAATATAPPSPRGPSSMALASLSGAPKIAAPATVPVGQAQTASLSPPDRLAVGDIYGQTTGRTAEDEPVEATTEAVPLPPHRPRIVAVPFPRPRPQVHGEEQAQAQSEQPQTIIDFLTSGWR